MRSLIARLALVGTVGAALAGCGTNGSSLPVGAPLNGAGGGPVNVTNQPAPGGAIKGLAIDLGDLTTGKYTGFNTTATDTQSAAEAGTDTATAGSGAPPTDPATGQKIGSHAVSYTLVGQNPTILAYGGTVPPLVLPAVTPGAVVATNYGAIVLFTTVKAISIELVGGSGATQYDVRIACKATTTPAAATTAGFTRFVCPLPAYGAASAQSNLNPVVASQTPGAFTPLAPKLYVVLPGVAANAVNGVVGIDNVYAEQGTN